MQHVKIVGVATENPEAKWTQEEFLDSVGKNRFISVYAKDWYKRFLADKGIESRYFGLSSLDRVNIESPDEAHQRFEQVATLIGAQAARKCLFETQTRADEISALIVTTCTGYLCPGLTSYISEAIGLQDSIYALDLTGLGCGAAIPAVRTAHQYLQLHPDANVLVVSVEICSAASSWGDDVDLILSNTIFGDGAAACLLSNRKDSTGYEVLRVHSLLWPEHRNQLRFQKKEARLRNVINRSVPKIAAKAVKQLDGELKQTFQGAIHYYGIHPGGRRVLDEIEKVMGLEAQCLARSRSILRQFGNMSSPSIFYVLKEITMIDCPKAGEHTALFTFGAGFSAFVILLKSDGF